MREDYQDRNSGRETLLQQASLLGVSPQTLEANVQWFADNDLDYVGGILLSTKPQTKRKKLAWILREMFNYREVPKEDKRAVIALMYDFVRENPRLLIYSIGKLERDKEKIKNKMRKYFED